MSNDYYNPTGNPGTAAQGLSALMRTEFANIAAGFAKLPGLSGNNSKAVIVNSGGTGFTTTTGTLALAGNFATTGAFNLVMALGASITLTLPAVNGTLATLAGTETLTNKTLSSGTFSGTFTGNPTFSGNATFSGSTLHVSAVTTFSSTSTFNGASLFIGALNGNVINANTINVATLVASGQSEFDDNVTVGGALFAAQFAVSVGTTLTVTGSTVSASYKVGSNQVVGARNTGWTAGTGGTPNKGAIDYSTATLAQLANRVMALEQALFATTGHGLIGT